MEVIVGTGCYSPEEDLFGASAGKDETDGVKEFLFVLELALTWEVLSKA